MDLELAATTDGEEEDRARAASESTQLAIERMLLLRLATNLNILTTCTSADGFVYSPDYFRSISSKLSSFQFEVVGDRRLEIHTSLAWILGVM